MVDEMFDRTYQAGRAQLHARIDTALETLRCSLVKTFRSVEAIQFQAPWRPHPRKAGCA